MYGGDEVSAIVIDLGSHTCKAGYAGEDAPKAVFPSGLDIVVIAISPCFRGFLDTCITTAQVVGSIDQMDVDDMTSNEKNVAVDSKNNVKDSEKGKGKRKLFIGSQALGFRRDHMEVLSPFKDGIVADWDIVDSIWDHAFRECLLIDPKEHPMLLAEPSSNSQQQRERTAELMFEKYTAPALFFGEECCMPCSVCLVPMSPICTLSIYMIGECHSIWYDSSSSCCQVLTSFASGRATSLVVDSGGGSTTITPVHDGYVIQKAVAFSPIGGELLTDCLMKSLESKGVMIKPRYSFKRKEIQPGVFQTVDLDFPNTTDSYKLYSQRVIASDIKESVCRAPDTPYD
ncbi:hypothetical protein OIU79_030225, partial [Salix purpurea]